MRAPRFSLLLAAVEEAGDEEEQREHETQLGVRTGVQVKPEDSIDEPRGTSDKPDPRCLSHRFVLDEWGELLASRAVGANGPPPLTTDTEN